VKVGRNDPLRPVSALREDLREGAHEELIPRGGSYFQLSEIQSLLRAESSLRPSPGMRLLNESSPLPETETMVRVHSTHFARTSIFSQQGAPKGLVSPLLRVSGELVMPRKPHGPSGTTG
jgi:hypothetical protein